MKSKKLLAAISVILIFACIFSLTGCLFSEPKSQDYLEPPEEYDIEKIIATDRKVAIVFSGTKSNALERDIKALFTEYYMAYSPVTRENTTLVLRTDSGKLTVDPTQTFIIDDLTSHDIAKSLADETFWGSVICVDLTSERENAEIVSSIKHLLDGYLSAGFTILTPQDLMASNEDPMFEDPLDIANYPTLTTAVPFGVQASNPVDYSYFDDAVFIGDSITQKLQMYAAVQRRVDPNFLGDAKFLSSTSLGLANCLNQISNTSLHPMYNGKKQFLWDSVAQMGAGKVYIMLGVNDLTWASYDSTLSHLTELIGHIKEISPNADIYIQSLTPRVKQWNGTPDNEDLFGFNLRLVTYCEENGYHFIDTAYALRGEDGALPYEYCSDPNGLGMHFTNEACAVWIDYLRTHTP